MRNLECGMRNYGVSIRQRIKKNYARDASSGIMWDVETPSPTIGHLF